MAKRMVLHSERDAEEVGVIDYKAKVLAVYPSATFVDGFPYYSRSVVWHYVTGSGHHTIGVGNSEEESWRDAWTWIEYQTMKILES